MNRDPNGPPHRKGEYPRIPPREGLEGVPEESEPSDGRRWVEVFMALALAAAAFALLCFMAWWSVRVAD